MEYIILSVAGIGMMLLALLLPLIQKKAVTEEDRRAANGRTVRWLLAIFAFACATGIVLNYWGDAIWNFLFTSQF